MTDVKIDRLFGDSSEDEDCLLVRPSVRTYVTLYCSQNAVNAAVTRPGLLRHSSINNAPWPAVQYITSTASRYSFREMLTRY